MTAVRLLLEIIGGFDKARPGEQLHMADPRRLANGCYGRLDRGDGAQASIENDHAAGAEPQQTVGDLGDRVLEGPVGQADAAGISDEGRISAVGEGRPNQRIGLVASARAKYSANS